MNRKIWIGIGIIAVLIIIAAIGIGLGGTDNGDDKKPQTGQEQEAAVQSGTTEDDQDDAGDADDADNNAEDDVDEDGDSDESGVGDDQSNDDVDDSDNSHGQDSSNDSDDADADNDTDNDDSENDDDDGSMTYEKYVSMPAEDQQAYFETFDDPEDFFDWYNAEKEKYEQAHQGEEITDGSIDLGDYID